MKRDLEQVRMDGVSALADFSSLSLAGVSLVFPNFFTLTAIHNNNNKKLT